MNNPNHNHSNHNNDSIAADDLTPNPVAFSNEATEAEVDVDVDDLVASVWEAQYLRREARMRSTPIREPAQHSTLNRRARKRTVTSASRAGLGGRDEHVPEKRAAAFQTQIQDFQFHSA